MRKREKIMKAVIKFGLGLMVAVGIILILGAAGSDCDGKCMENAMPIGEMLMYSALGLVLIALGAAGLVQMNEE
jgi:hypothetical protein